MATTGELRKIVRMSTYDVGTFETEYQNYQHTMISPAEAYCLKLMTQLIYKGRGSIAELGSFLGGTSCVFGRALQNIDAPKGSLEVYDFFQHNAGSRKRLVKDPLYDEKSFYRIWQRNTEAYQEWITVYAGDLREQATRRKGPIEFLYVDIVKNEVLINSVMHYFLSELLVGDGLLFHQDYFHWQSPWVVYTTEMFIDYFEFVGTISNHTAVFRKTKNIPSKLLAKDFVKEVSWEEKLRLMDRAIDRFPGIRAGLLEVSKLNLGLGFDGFSYEKESARVRKVHSGNARAIRYLDVLDHHREDYQRGDRSMW